MQPGDLVRLQHMLDAAKEALGFAVGRSRADLDRDRMWLDIIGMRHRLIHAYFDVNLDIVWATVTDDLAPLVTRLEEILQ